MELRGRRSRGIPPLTGSPQHTGMMSVVGTGCATQRLGVVTVSLVTVDLRVSIWHARLHATTMACVIH